MHIDSKTLLDFVGHFADFAGIISLIISIITLKLASGIRSSMLERIEKKSFEDSAETLIDGLSSYRKMLSKDAEIINDDFYKNVHDTLIEILDDYRTILPHEIKGKIKRLDKRISCYLKKKNKPNDFGRVCSDRLHSIISDLRKERGLL